MIPQVQTNASINIKPEGGGEGGGGTPGICGAIDFSEESLVKIVTMGPQNLVKSDQISSTFQRLIFKQSKLVLSTIHVQYPQSKVFHQFILKMSSEKPFIH